jgi:hypothetical protein
MATGFEQVRSVVAAIAGDFAAADRVELDLPQTGVCGAAGVGDSDPDPACCGPALRPPASVVAADAPAGVCGASSAVATLAAPSRCCD